MAMYKSQKVTTRVIKPTDKGFDPNVEKIIVVKPDGTEEAVPRAEVTGNLD